MEFLIKLTDYHSREQIYDYYPIQIMYVSGKEKQNRLLIEIKKKQKLLHINLNIILDLCVI